MNHDEAGESRVRWWDPNAPWGFRFSLRDGAAITVMAAASGVLWWSLPELAEFASLPVILIAHFFLFCNTFRIGAIRELSWAGLLLVNAAAWAFAGEISVMNVFITQTPFTVIVLVWALLSQDYSGVLCTRINPKHYRAAAASEGLFGIRIMRYLRFREPWIRGLSGKDPDAVMGAAASRSETEVD